MPSSLRSSSYNGNDTEVEYSLPSNSLRDSISYEGTVSVKRKSLDLVRNLEETPEIKTESSLSMEDLYPNWNTMGLTFSTALRLIGEARRYIDQALEFHTDKDMISADDEIQKLQALLPELFCCRPLGDGFGQIVNATMNAFGNTSGIPLNEDQTIALKRVFYSLAQEPFISFDKATDVTEILEEVGLIIEPPGFNKLTDLLVELSDE